MIFTASNFILKSLQYLKYFNFFSKIKIEQKVTQNCFTFAPQNNLLKL